MILTMVAKMFLLVSVLNMMSYIQKVSSFKATVLMPPIATTTNFMSGGFYEGPKKTPPATTSLAAPPRSARTKFAGSGFYQGPAETPLTVSVIVAQSKFAGSGFYMVRKTRPRDRSRPSTSRQLQPQQLQQKLLIQEASIWGRRNPPRLRPQHPSTSRQPQKERLIQEASIWGRRNPPRLRPHRPSTSHQPLQPLQPRCPW